MLAEEIIIAPVVTEKSNDELQEGRYTFKVNKKATKVQIAQAVEKLFNVKVLKVNTMHVNGKTKRVGYHVGKTSDWKKAILTWVKVVRKLKFLRSIRILLMSLWVLRKN